MKKQLITDYLFFPVLAALAFADDTDTQQRRLNQVNSFHTSFIWLVNGTEGIAVYEGEG